jgi:hypothetical protein
MKYIGKTYAVTPSGVTTVKTSQVAQTVAMAQDGTTATVVIKAWGEE